MLTLRNALRFKIILDFPVLTANWSSPKKLDR